MHLKKTEIGMKTLQKPAPYLKLRMRQISNLTDGTHSRGSIQSLMQRDLGDELHWLLQSGFLDEQVNARYEVSEKRMQSQDNKFVQL